MKKSHILAIGGIPSIHHLLLQAGATITLMPAGGHPARPDLSLYRNIVDVDTGELEGWPTTRKNAATSLLTI